MRNIIQIVCDSFGVSVESILSKDRHHHVNVMRWTLWQYLHERMGVSAAQLARLFSRSRISIFRGIRVHKQMMVYDVEMRDNYARVIEKIEDAIKSASPNIVMEEKDS